jgi:drug/metabolite transporter (DMT)-like permease
MKRGVAAVLSAGCLWGAVGVFVRVLDDARYSPLTVVFVRMSIAFVLLAVFLLISGRASFFRIKLRHLPLFAGTGVSSAIMLNLFYSMSTVMNPLAVASILLATAPVFVVILSAPIFKEKITVAKAQSLVIVFAGCVLTSGNIGGGVIGAASGMSGVTPQGIAIGLLAGIGWGLYGITTRFCLNRGYKSLTVNIYSFLIGGVACAPFTNFGVIVASISAAPGYMTMILILHTLVASLLPYSLFTYGMNYMDTGKASILASIEPVVATLIGFFFYGEKPDGVTIAGIALVLFGIVLLNLPNGVRSLRPPRFMRLPDE